MLVELHMANHSLMKYKDEENEVQLHLNLDVIDEVRRDVEQRIARYKNLMARQHDEMVKPRRLNLWDVVLNRFSLATKDLAHGKGPTRFSIAKGKDPTTWRLWIRGS